MTNIYIFDFGNRIKIGKANDVRVRLKQIENSAGERAVNQFFIEANQEIETLVHRALKKYRTVGEYFKCPFAIAKKELLYIVENFNKPILPLKEKEKIEELQAIRNSIVKKHNFLIRNSHYDLSMQEQKIILHLITKIKKEDTDFHLYKFNINDFCQVCGIDTNNGTNYATIKAAIKKLTEKFIRVKLNDGKETLLQWIEQPTINKQSGIIEIKFNEFMRPFLLELKKNYTKYKLYYVLSMQSKYSIRLYELLKSYEFISEIEFELEALKKMMSTEKYTAYKDFRVNVLDIAVKEINDFGDIKVTYTTVKKGKKVDRIIFDIMPKMDTIGKLERIATFKKVEKKLSK